MKGCIFEDGSPSSGGKCDFCYKNDFDDDYYFCSCGECMCRDCNRRLFVIHGNLFCYLMKQLIPFIRLTNIENSELFKINIQHILQECKLLNNVKINNNGERYNFDGNYLDVKKDLIEKNDNIEIFRPSWGLDGGFRCFHTCDINKLDNILTVYEWEEDCSCHATNKDRKVKISLKNVAIAKPGSIFNSYNTRFVECDALIPPFIGINSFGQYRCLTASEMKATVRAKNLQFGINARKDRSGQWFIGRIFDFNVRIRCGQAKFAMDPKRRENVDAWNYYAKKNDSNDSDDIDDDVPNGFPVPINDEKVIRPI